MGMGQWNVYRVIGGNGSVESIQGDSRREMIVPAL